MKMIDNKCVIFGGSGFIGSHFASTLLHEGECDKVVLVDIEPIDLDRFGQYLSPFIDSEKLEFVQGDVRQYESLSSIPKDNVSLVVNLAAIHREPGHEVEEYFKTNLLGAENVCKWAEEVSCEKIIFTSSIAPYGPSETVKSEDTIPCPETAYGSSKLAAEKIHQCWLSKNSEKRSLVIVRPGVVFGPGEGGNVTRLVRAVIGRYFFYMGNQETVKAGIYVKELCNAMLWAFKKVENSKNSLILFNATMNPAPTVKEYVDAICRVANIKRRILSVPYAFLMFLTSVIDAIAKPFGMKHPFSPVRIKKLVRSNSILPNYLIHNKYQYKFSLESAFSDWKADRMNDWH